MGLRFNMLLEGAGIDPAEVRLLRHETDLLHRHPGQYRRGSNPYSLWNEDPAAFEQWQSTQDTSQRALFRGRYWASFVAPYKGSSMFVGLYSVKLDGPAAGEPGADQYVCQLMEALSEYRGKLYVHWGDTSQSMRAWKQLASNQDKRIVELRLTDREEAFPGIGLVRRLSDIEAMPQTWKDRLTEAKGVYLLVCPRTGKQYIGSASSDDGGFLGRWRNYVANGHGGNIGMRKHGATDWVVTIVEIMGSAATRDEIVSREELWKLKLLTKDFGLNL